MKKNKTTSLFNLIEIASTFNESSADKKKQLLIDCSSIKLNSKKIIEQYHNCLLFLLGYPENEELFLLAQKELERLSLAVKNSTKTLKDQLERTGITYTQTQAANSFTLIKWLLNLFPGQVSLHSFDETGIHPKEILRHALSEMEFELAFSEKLNPIKWIETAAGSKNKNIILNWLINHFEKIDAADLIKDQLFESLKIYIFILPTNKILSKGFGNFDLHKKHFHTNGLLKRFDEKEIINKKLPAPKKLSVAEKNTIIEKARIALFLLNRETEPIVYCNADGLKFYELEHGLSIGLFSILPERRLPLESYIGFMMFKNGYPMSYGGGWLFGNRSLLGINIFESFRGGESAFVFCQLLRTYKQSFGANYFEVEPYQFGKNNPEGLKSGAFWFYYRFGFRPIDADLKQLALKEAEKIQNIKGYRTSIETLKQFTNSNLAVNFNKESQPLNPSLISEFISAQINLKFNGDRNASEKWCLSVLKTDLGIDINKANKSEKIGIKKLSFFIGFCIQTKKLTASEKNKLKRFVVEKGNSEFNYIEISNTLNFKKIFVKELSK
ncbi:MAG: hypothetical protein Q7W45_09285 [Bacteroidota bacterium]|nr:hypothetical protein [Bacteroidota bacterium]MDP3144129.1 hypothetical protein [Bacteroidota bacterium]